MIISSGMSDQNPKITINRGVVCNARYSFTKGNDKSNIKIVKNESCDLTYKLSAAYNGLKDTFPSWTILINDKRPKMGNGDLCFTGSKAFVFKPAGKDVIEIQETDTYETASIWIDLATETYEVSRKLPITSEKIKALIEKGKTFKPADDKLVKKIIYENDAGVFLYARNNLHAVIYYANETDEFVECQSKSTSQCNCKSEDSVWEIKLPTESEPHILRFPKGDPYSGGHVSIISLDKTPMKIVAL